MRKLATENDVDLATVKGTGVGGRIRKQDVLAAASEKESAKDTAKPEPAAEAPAKASSTAPAPEAALAHLRGTKHKANRIRQITAKKTRESLQTTAQLTQTHEVDMTKIVSLRSRAKAKFAEREGVNLTYLPFIARAVIDALKIHPNVNASYNEEAKEITYYDAEHLGFAVDTDQGLLSPVIKNAGDLSLGGLARAIADIAARARSGNLKPDELSGGTFTITNIGSQGALFDTPILVPPQAAMLGTGAIVKRPRVIVDEFGNESIGVRSVSYLPLTYDHRLIDGADAGTIRHHHQAPPRRGRVRGRPGAVVSSVDAIRFGHRVAGSSGLIGTALVYALRATDRRVLRIVRRAPSNADEVYWNPDTGEFDPDTLRGVDAVVNLCGVNVGQKRWSGAFKQSLRDSRIGPTEVLSSAVVDAGVPTLINASAVGYYGDTGNRPVDETAGPGHNFLARLSVDWETATEVAADSGVRVVLTRTGLVMAPSGGLLSRLKPLFSLGLGARLGNGRQYLPWISLEDQVRALLFAITHDELSGPVNFAGPAPVTNAEFTTALGPHREPPDTVDGPGVRAPHGARRVRRRGPAGWSARDPRGAGAGRLPLPPPHHRRGPGVCHCPERRLTWGPRVSWEGSRRSAGG